jgi:hypothetical protein
MRRVSSAVAVGLAVGLAVGQLWLARSSRMLDLADAYAASTPQEWGNDAWPSQLVVVVWCAAAAVVVATAIAGLLVGAVRWRYLLPVCAGLGALASVPLAVDWVSTISSTDERATTVAGAGALIGVLFGAAVSAAVVAWRGVGRSSLVWVAWVTVNLAATVLAHQTVGSGRGGGVPVQPLGVFLWGASPYDREGTTLALLPAVFLTGVLAWWARRRREPVPVAGAVAVPVLLVAGHLAVPLLLGGGSDGDADSLAAGLGAWVMVTVLGCGAAGLGVLLGTAGPDRPGAGVAAPTAEPALPVPADDPHRPPDEPVRVKATRAMPESLPPSAVRRTAAGVGVAGAVAVCAAFGQLGLGRSLRVLVLEQTYNAGNDTWPFQLLLLVWCAACATVLGGVAGGRLVGGGHGRYLVALAAAGGALVPAPSVAGWATGAIAVSADPGRGVLTAFVLGALVGAPVVVAAGTWPGLRRSASVWTSLIWCSLVVEVVIRTASTDVSRVVPADPLGVLTPGWFDGASAADLVGWLPPIVVAAVLGWRAANRNERGPVLTAIVGPSMVTAVHLVVPWLPGGRDDGDHYSLPADCAVWILLSALALAAAAVGTRLARRRHGPEPATADR